MRHPSRIAVAMLITLAGPGAAFAQVGSPPLHEIIGFTLPADVLRDLPVGDSVYGALETTQTEVISDRFTSGGFNIAGGARVGGFLGSWSQTLFRVGDIDISDPAGGGASLLFPSTLFWERAQVTTGMMPPELNTPGLAISLVPKRPGMTWTGMVIGSGAGGSLVAKAPANQPPPIARLRDAATGSAVVSGPLSDRLGLVLGGTWGRASAWRREQLASTRDLRGTGFMHLVFAPSATREFRLLGWGERAETPFQEWQAFQAPSASTTDRSTHVQGTWEQRPAGGPFFRVYGGFTERRRTNEVASDTVVMDRIVAGPVPDVAASSADSTTRRGAAGARLSWAMPPESRHRPELGLDLNLTSTRRFDHFSGLVREFVDTTPARVWGYRPSDDTRWQAANASGFLRDVIQLSSAFTLDTSVRLDYVRGRADGGTTPITWFSVLPRAHFRWVTSDDGRTALVGGYGRTANTLNLRWLAFGDSTAPIATVTTANPLNQVIARVGPGTGGDSTFSRIDPDLARPYTDEFVIGIEQRRTPALRFTLIGIARREGNLLGVVNPNAALSNYTSFEVTDPNTDWDQPTDDRPLTIYNQLPSSFGKDSYVVTNPEQSAAEAYALRLTGEYTGNRLFLLFGTTAHLARGNLSSRGYGPLENDQDQPGEIFTSPNAASYARGRLFLDRAFTIKWTTLYRLPGNFSAAAIARYQDGQPFARMVVVPTLNQGAEGVQAYPNAGSRFMFTGTLDLRLQKTIPLGAAKVDVIFDAYNLMTRSNSVEEYVVTSPTYRESIAIEPPHTLHLGLRLTF
jgi:hypothetical protein